MESFDILIVRARKTLDIAEHVLLETYPLVDEPKLILAVAGDVYAALVDGMRAFLLHENRLGKAIDFSSEFAVFQELARENGLAEEDTNIITTLHDIMSRHKDSPVEFSRKGRFVSCDENYNMSIISAEGMKSYLFRAKLLIGNIEQCCRRSKK